MSPRRSGGRSRQTQTRSRMISPRSRRSPKLLSMLKSLSLLSSHLPVPRMSFPLLRWKTWPVRHAPFDSNTSGPSTLTPRVSNHPLQWLLKAKRVLPRMAPMNNRSWSWASSTLWVQHVAHELTSDRRFRPTPQQRQATQPAGYELQLPHVQRRYQTGESCSYPPFASG